jgi:hypothetical protein
MCPILTKILKSIVLFDFCPEKSISLQENIGFCFEEILVYFVTNCEPASKDFERSQKSIQFKI